MYRCRLCLGSSELYFSVFDTDLIEKIESLTAIRIMESDELPKTCCEFCVANVHTTYEFQQQIVKSEETLREELQSKGYVGDVKAEPDVSVNEVEVSVDKDEIKEIHSNEYVCDVKGEPDMYINEVEVGTDVKDIINEIQVKFIDHSDNIEVIEEVFVDSSNIYSILENPHCNVGKSEPNVMIIETKNDKNFNVKKSNNVVKVIDVESVILKDLVKEEKEEHVLRKIVTSKYDKNPSWTVPKKIEKLQNVTYKEKQGLECKHCGHICETPKSLRIHAMKHNLRTCKICDITIRADNFRKHVEMHSALPEICEVCGKTAKNKESLRSHIYYQHRSTQRFKCEYCTREFKRNNLYVLHVKKVHKGTRDHQCHICGKKFFTVFDLNKHISMTHARARPYVCPYCKKGFSSSYARKTHVRQHTLETPYRCDICADGFRQKVSLTTHLKSKHNITK